MEANTPQGMEEMLTQMGISNPKSIALAKLMDQQQSQNGEAEQETDSRLEKLYQENVQLRKTVKALRELNGDFASAVGACPNCWGQDRSCKTCHGYGSPGAGEISDEAYAFFIAPMLDQMASHN